MNNALNWFEIPAVNFERAVKFYSTILDSPLDIHDMGSAKMGFLPCEQKSVGGAIVQQPGHNPGPGGTRVYLNGGENLQPILNRVEPAGGRIILGKTKVNDEIGYYAVFTDTEGNQIALHSPK